MKISIIIPAAGRGRRFGSTKQFESLQGRPLLLYALEAFEVAPRACEIGEICLVIPPGEEGLTSALIGRHFLKKIKIVPGGEERQNSVERGLEAIASTEIVVIHDGARPFVTKRMIEEVILAASEFGGAVVGLPIHETTKRVSEDRFVHSTIDRGSLWSIQTPQAFRYPILKKAFQKASEDRFIGTDEAMLVERIGERVKVIEGSPRNIKVTTPEDWKIAEAFLKMGSLDENRSWI